MNKKLIETLNAAQKSVEIYNSPDGTTVLMLPYGGRILGLFAPRSEKNFYWTNPVLENASSAKEFFDGEQWQNTGGDRTWLAPEVDFFFPKLVSPFGYCRYFLHNPSMYILDK